MYIYHYHATFQHLPGEIHNVDGIIETSEQINTMEVYEQMKHKIAERNGFDENRVIICSLSLLRSDA